MARVRFDDSLRTVLQAETRSDAGAQAAWRQLSDLIGRGRVAADEGAVSRLRSLRPAVSASVRAASARALALSSPPAALVGVFGEDVPEVAAPVLRIAMLAAAEWEAILPRLSPAGRSVLRHRRDLPAETVRGLAAFGTTDFVLAYAGPARATSPERIVEAPAPAATKEPGRSEIADLVARIDAFNRTRERPAAVAAPPPVDPITLFRFETDATAIVRWVEGVARGPLIGLNLALSDVQGHAQVEGGVAGACRRRAAFRDARLLIGGSSDAAGGWRLSGVPAFDPASGRFVGYRGTGRRPRSDESAAPARVRETADTLRQLVHELRTPINAIAGFAELIHTELLGPVAAPYVDHAAAIRVQVGALVAAIDDLDTAARIDGRALALRLAPVALHPLLLRTLADLRPLADLRGADVALVCDDAGTKVVADEPALERLIARLLAALISAAGRGERLTVAASTNGASVNLTVDKPVALDCADDAELEGASLLGTAFALRLAGRLAGELGGALVTTANGLTLRLPSTVDRDMGQATIN